MPILNTGQIISFGDGRLACSIQEIYSGLNALLDENLMTHQIARAGDFVAPHIVEAHPWVKDLPKAPPLTGLSDDMRIEVLKAWVRDISSKHGDSHVVPDLSGLWIHLDPVDEILAMAQNGEVDVTIVTVDLDEDDS